MKKKIFFSGCVLLFSGIAMLSNVYAVDILYHQDAVKLLFKQLELVDHDTVVSFRDQQLALEELNFQPPNGYKPTEPMTYGDFAVILVHIYGYKMDASRDQIKENSIAKLAEENIFVGSKDVNQEVPFQIGVDIIKSIPPTPGYNQSTVTLPRYLPEPPISRCEP